MTTYYGNDYPKQNEIVFVVITEISDESIYCDLVEYGKKKGLLQRKELDRKVYPNPKKFFSENKVYPMLVLGVDEENGHIDLNHSRIKEKEREYHMENFNYFSKLYNLMHEFIILSSLSSESIFPQTLWKFLQKDNIDESKKLFLTLMDSPDVILKDIKDDHPDEVINYLIDLEPRITKTSMYVKQDFDLRATCKNGIGAIREILEIDSPDFEIKYIVAPTYRIFAEGKTQEECDNKIKKCFDIVIENMKKFGNKVSLSIGEKKNIKEREITIKYKNIR